MFSVDVTSDSDKEKVGRYLSYCKEMRECIQQTINNFDRLPFRQPEMCVAYRQSLYHSRRMVDFTLRDLGFIAVSFPGRELHPERPFVREIRHRGERAQAEINAIPYDRDGMDMRDRSGNYWYLEALYDSYHGMTAEDLIQQDGLTIKDMSEAKY